MVTSEGFELVSTQQNEDSRLDEFPVCYWAFSLVNFMCFTFSCLFFVQRKHQHGASSAWHSDVEYSASAEPEVASGASPFL